MELCKQLCSVQQILHLGLRNPSTKLFIHLIIPIVSYHVLPINASMYLSICLSLYLSSYLAIYVSTVSSIIYCIHLPSYPIYPSIYPSIHLLFYLPNMTIYLSTSMNLSRGWALLVINGVITPINGLINGWLNWGYFNPISGAIGP